MKVVFNSQSSTDTIIEAKSAWQNFLKGRMGKGKSLKELSVEFKKLQKEGKIDDKGNVTESAGPKSKKSKIKMNRPGGARRAANHYSREDLENDLSIHKKINDLEADIDDLREELKTSYSESQLEKILKEKKRIEEDEFYGDDE